MRRVLATRLAQASVVLVCITFFLLLLRSHQRNRSADFQEEKNEANTPELRLRRLRRVKEFWQPFENGILAAKPACPPLQLAGQAQAAGATPKEVLRTKPRNYVNEAVVSDLKASHEQFRQVLDTGFDKQGRLRHRNINDLFKGKGVVTVAGGEYFGPALVGILMLRRTGSKLPVEAFLANKQEYEEEICETVLPTMNARCVILTDFANSTSEAGFEVSHYQLKSLAMLFSSFKDILYLDSDSLPLVEPYQELFMKEPYTSTGFVGWPDFWKGSESPLFYDIAGLPSFPGNLPAASSEAGQLLIDKGRHLKTLLLATYYNIWGPDYYYPLLSQGVVGQGDKNTFESAATVLGIPWYRVRTPVKGIGRSDAGEFRGSAMVQYHPFDDFKRHGSSLSVKTKSSLEVFAGLGPQKKIRAAFIHANTPKMNAGHLADEGDLQDSETREHLRLWGPRKSVEAIFGKDMEKITFRYVIESGCKYVRMLKDWEGRGSICKRLMEHYNIIFYNDS